ncbi:hypothetical protein GCM10023149_17850 [Mucilaginibacter gynuensis]|uniref:YcxB-like C-terminal domain-containing protein n=1 Tax=Mucilaginibacter gynuensis TaxID=1302236 RepID=A0ABP8G838_9SPHI
MKIQFKLDFKEFLKLQYLLTYRKPRTIIITSLGVLLLAYSILCLTGNWNDEAPYMALIVGVYTVLLPLIIYLSVKRSFSNNARLQEIMSYEFTDKSIRVTGESFNAEYSWEKTHKVWELNNWILIYQNSRSASVIPKSSFSDTQLWDFKYMVKNVPGLKAKLK